MAPVTSRKLTAEFRGSGEKLLATRLGADGISGHCRSSAWRVHIHRPWTTTTVQNTHIDIPRPPLTATSPQTPLATTTQSSAQLTPLEARDVSKSVVLWYLSLEGARGQMWLLTGSSIPAYFGR